ncbi:glutathione S-transferase [Paraburkholderia hospita]|uniref:Glutathione S-transferase n=1 Tax=Paraburkholderia hospita TaxID=169430 RepID=A0ABN0FHD9_9BURK|nr:glutathione transferase [Paraburkholderia hospita]EIM98148.1 glutathione S-transferase [Paraburkholderia hospita]OUL74594.1 glutathione S-transferase [Paraburkholderia hospita]
MSSANSLLLYVDAQFASPYAMSVFVALHEKHLTFDMRTVDLGRHANNEPDYAATSVTQRVPTLVHDGFAVSESSAITEYIDDAFEGTPLYPADKKQRARARQIQAWLRSDLMPIRSERPTEVVFYGAQGGALTAIARKAADKLFPACDAWLAPGAQYLFDDWCIADVDLALMLNRLVLNGDDVPKHLADYAQHQWQRPSVQRWVQLQRPPL